MPTGDSIEGNFIDNEGARAGTSRHSETMALFDLDVRSRKAQQRYELARDLAHGFAASGIRGGTTTTVKLIAIMAVETADALLELLAKEPEPDKEPG